MMLKRLLSHSEWTFLFKISSRVFCKIFIQFLRALYSSLNSKDTINGSSLKPNEDAEKISPISPSLFNLFIKPMAQAISEEITLEGITIGGAENKICLYADDVLITLKNSTLS